MRKLSSLARWRSMSPNLFMGRGSCLRQSLPLSRSTPPCCSPAPTEASSPYPNFATQYLVQSCGLSSSHALKASKVISHLKSPNNPDAVLRFLREVGVPETDIATAVSQDARILCSGLETNWRPNIAKLHEAGLSTADISGLISRRPYIFRHNFAPKVDFWMQVLGSSEFLSVVLKSDPSLLFSSLENVLIPNLSFLKDRCGLSTRHLLRLIKSTPRVLTSRPDALEKLAERAEQLGVTRFTRAFPYALAVVGYLDQSTIDARLNNLKTLGFSEEEVTAIISRLPLLLSLTEELIRRKIDFLINEFGCDKSYLVKNPSVLTNSLDMRLIPRNHVRKLLKSKGISVANQTLATFVKATDKVFLGKFILPYEHDIPGLHQAYADACVVNPAAKGWLRKS